MPERKTVAVLEDAGLDRGVDRVAGLRFAAGLRIALTPARATVRAIAPKACLSERWTDRLNSGLSERRAISATAAKILMGWAHQDIAAAWGLSCRFELSSAESLLAHRRQIRATPMRHFCRHTDALAQCRMRMNGFANIHCICAHLNGQCNLANHVARMGADHAAAQDFAAAPASMAVT